jgi:hypothetical protein
MTPAHEWDDTEYDRLASAADAEYQAEKEEV